MSDHRKIEPLKAYVRYIPQHTTAVSKSTGRITEFITKCL